MAVRLYPNTDDPAELCRLAGVPVETFERLEKYEATRPIDSPENRGKVEAWYAGLFHDSNMNVLNSFLVFGWGRLKPDAHDYVRGIGDENAGSTSDPAQAQALLSLQGIVAEGVTSVHWS